MNTLSRALTARIFSNPASYDALRRHWSGLVNSDACHTLAAEHHLLYSVLLGRDWRRGFTPITNPRRLAQNGFGGWSLWFALARLHSPWHNAHLLAPFDGLVTTDMLAQVRALLPNPNPNHYQPADFAPSRYPFDAYAVVPALVRASPEPGSD